MNSIVLRIILFGLTLGLLSAESSAAERVVTGDTPVLSRDYKYWRGPELTPGAFLCRIPAATDVTVTCDRWPDTTDLRQFGLDAIRLSNAKTETEKCLAVFRWLRRVMLNSDAPYEPFAWDGCWDDYFKWLHSYGCHYCSGMGRSLEMYWRALGYPGSKVYTGHTVADAYYVDDDGVGRWHHFDVNRGRYMMDRTGKRLLSSAEISTDSGFARGSAVHRYQAVWSRHRAELSLRKGEKLKRIWGNWGKLYHKVIWADMRIKGKPLTWWFKQSEIGPYSADHGNGRWLYSPDPSAKDWTDALAELPVNMAADKFISVTAKIPATAIWHFRTPHVVSDAEVDLEFFRKSATDLIRLHLSVDNGKTWKPVWDSSAAKVGMQKLTVNICKKFTVSKKKKPSMDFSSPFGRYSWRIKLELVAEDSPEDCRVEKLTFRTTVQQNKFALPQLQPGRNNITVKGRLAKGMALQITYVWDDSKGKERKNVTLVEKTPYTYEIIAAGRKWEDCTSRSLLVEAIAADGQGSRTLVKEEASPINKLPPLPSVHDTCGTWPLSKRNVPPKLPPLEDVLKKLNTRTAYGELKSVVLPQLIEHASPKAWDATEKFIRSFSEIDLKKANKLMKAKKSAVIALYVADASKGKTRIRAWLREFVKDAELNRACEANVATIAQLNKWTEFVPYLAETLKKGHGPIPILKAFFVIGDQRTAAAVKPYLKNKNQNVVALAALAAGRTGDKSMIPRLRELMRMNLALIENIRPAKINAAVALGMLKDKQSVPEIRKFLKYVYVEMWRAKAARALGYMGDKSSIPVIKAALDVEPVAWVRDAMTESIEMLEKGKINVSLLGGEAWLK
jgi:HEAT repeats